MSTATAQHIRTRHAVTVMMTGRKHRRRPVPRQQQPNAIRLAYSQALLAVQGRAHALVSAKVLPALPGLVRAAGIVHDAVGPSGYAEALSELVGQVSRAFFGEFTNERLRRLVLPFGQRVSDFNRLQLQRQFRAALGIDVLQSEPQIGPRLQAWAAENVALIKSVPTRYFGEIETWALQALRKGERAEEIARDLQERFDVSESRARLIARDQVGKLNGQLNIARQRDVGVERWVWRTSEDERVRPEHEELDGRVYTIDDSPAEGYPGEPIACRCTAEPLVQELIDAL